MRSTLLLILFLPLITMGQNACKNCSEFSVNKKWQELITCVSNEIENTNNISDYMCRAQCYGIALENTDSLQLIINGTPQYVIKKEMLNLALEDLNTILEKDSSFAFGIPYQQRARIKKALEMDYCDDLKSFCEMTKNCKDFESDCKN